MEIHSFHLGGANVAVIRRAVELLRNGGIVAHPTDTCYGLAVDITNPVALKHLYLRKGMEFDKPVSVLVRSLEEAQKYGVFSVLALRLAREFWPGPLTLVVPRTEAGPVALNPGVPDIGLRVIVNPVANALLDAYDGPLTTTSANAHGHPSPSRVKDIYMEPDLILDAGELKTREKPSTVLRVLDEEATTLRQGGLFLDRSRA